MMALPIATITEAVAQHFGVSVADIRSERRHADTTLARHVAMTMARRLTPRSLSVIGRQFGRRDHTTVINAVRRIAALEVTDVDLAHDIAVLTVNLKKRLEELQMRQVDEAIGQIDALGVAARVMRSPRRGAIGLSVIETVAVCAALIVAETRLAQIAETVAQPASGEPATEHMELAAPAAEGDPT